MYWLRKSLIFRALTWGAVGTLALMSVSCSSPRRHESDLDRRWREATEAFNQRVYGVSDAASQQVKKVVAAATPSDKKLYEWHGDDLSGALSISIDLSDQMAYFKRGGSDAGWSYIASGVAKHPTPTGSYRITEKQADKYSNLYGVIYDQEGNVVMEGARVGRDKIPAGGQFDGASMPYWMRLTSGGIGLHAGPIPNPGYPASHGCIRLPATLAETVFQYAKIGTPVSIRGRAPSY